MAVTRQDEVLDKALPTDLEIIARWDMKLPDGSIPFKDFELILKNLVLARGTVFSAQVLNEMLAASGICGGTAAALTLEQENFQLVDGAVIRFRLQHKPIPAPDVTIEIPPFAPTPIRTARGKALRGAAAGSWVTAVYSEPLGFFVLQGDGSDASSQRTFFHRLMTNTLNVRGW